jgi:hypothetical protein
MSEAAEQVRAPATGEGRPALVRVGRSQDLAGPGPYALAEGWAAEYGPLYLFRMGRCPVVALALIYKSFTVTREGSADTVREAFAFTMSPSGLRIRLARRAARA